MKLSLSSNPTQHTHTQVPFIGAMLSGGEMCLIYSIALIESRLIQLNLSLASNPTQYTGAIHRRHAERRRARRVPTLGKKRPQLSLK